MSEPTPSNWKSKLLLSCVLMSLLGVYFLVFASFFSPIFQALEPRMTAKWALLVLVLAGLSFAILVPLAAAWKLNEHPRFKGKFTFGKLTAMCMGALQVLFIGGLLLIQPTKLRENLTTVPSVFLGGNNFIVRGIRTVAEVRMPNLNDEESIKPGLNSPILEAILTGDSPDHDKHRLRFWESEAHIDPVLLFKKNYLKKPVRMTLSKVGGGYQDSLESVSIKSSLRADPYVEFSFKRPSDGWEVGDYNLEIFLEGHSELKVDIDIRSIDNQKVGVVERMLDISEANQILRTEGVWQLSLEPGVQFKGGVATVKRQGAFLGDAPLLVKGRTAYIRPAGVFVPEPGDEVYYRERGPLHCDITAEKHDASGTLNGPHSPDTVRSAVAFRKDRQFSLYLFETPLSDCEPAQVYTIRTEPYQPDVLEPGQPKPPIPYVRVLFNWTASDGVSNISAYHVKSRSTSLSDAEVLNIDPEDVETITVDQNHLDLKLKRLNTVPDWDIQINSDIWDVDEFCNLAQ